MEKWFVRFVREEEGQDLTEYAMLVALIAFVAIVGVTAFGEALQTWWNGVSATIGGWATS